MLLEKWFTNLFTQPMNLSGLSDEVLASEPEQLASFTCPLGRDQAKLHRLPRAVSDFLQAARGRLNVAADDAVDRTFRLSAHWLSSIKDAFRR